LTADGDGDVPVLCIPKELDGAMWAVVLRPPRRLVFTQQGEARFVPLVPMIWEVASTCETGPAADSDVAALRSELNSLWSLFDVRELISSELDPDKLVGTIMEKGRAYKHYSLFLVNSTRDRLIICLQARLVSVVNVPIDAGITRRCVSGTVLINIPDPCTSPYFDLSTDEGMVMAQSLSLLFRSPTIAGRSSAAQQ
jgi:hypothetical protein